MATATGASNNRIDNAGQRQTEGACHGHLSGLVQFQHKAILAGCLIFVALLIATPYGDE
jgi:hypothetical protein